MVWWFRCDQAALLAIVEIEQVSGGAAVLVLIIHELFFIEAPKSLELELVLPWAVLVKVRAATCGAAHDVDAMKVIAHR